MDVVISCRLVGENTTSRAEGDQADGKPSRRTTQRKHCAPKKQARLARKVGNSVENTACVKERESSILSIYHIG